MAGSSARAGVVGSGEVTVTRIVTYTTAGAGEVVFEVSTPFAGCIGGWLRPSDPGHEQNVAALLSARMSNRPVTVYVERDDVWPGSATIVYCRVYALAL